jgi:hypothetical protein
MKRFVVIATTLRGVVDPPESVGAEMDAVIFERIYSESSCGDVVVHWNSGSSPVLPQKRYMPCGREERLMELAFKTRKTA